MHWKSNKSIMKEFEYKIFKIFDPKHVYPLDTGITLSWAEFNNLGKEGWELVSVSDGIVYFKREKIKEDGK